MDIGETLYVTTASEWRAWLEANAASEPDIWLVYYKKDSGKPTIAYNHAVEEALCFGWIDSVNKRYGDDGRAQRFSPRRKGSALSEMNKVRMRRLVAEGRMTQAGLDAIDTSVLDEPFAIAPDILKALRADPETWRNFEAFADSYQRIRVGFVEGARNRPDVFETRLAYLLKMTKVNKQFGMVR